MDNIIKVTGQQQERIKLPMCGKDREGNLYEVDNLSLLKNGKRFFLSWGNFIIPAMSLRIGKKRS